ncbi:MAG: hypothetical protein JSU81_06290 [Candidatus Coatesbacteria bacterium]|nr:MAG: hypothetical protein JSU81_06290 [Candidatus Coatesbacteria bacterium]
MKKIVLLALALTLSCADSGLPPAPHNVSADSSGGGADVRWGYDDAPGLAHFIIQRSDGVNYNFRDWAQVPADRRTYRDDAVVVGEWYYYRVAAFFKEWNGQHDVRSKYSAEAGVKIE